MDFEKIEQAYQLVLENLQLIENQIKTNMYDALIEHNSFYLGAECRLEKVMTNNEQLKKLQLTSEEWRRCFQFILIKANQLEPLQANHQLTPDAIGFIILFLLETLMQSDNLEVLEIGSGTGNLAYTLLNNSQKTLSYTGIEVDDLLIDLSASIADVIKSDIQLIQEDAVRPQILKESDVVIGDLPIGYYPNDEISKRYSVATEDGHTYAHHLLIEQSLKYLKQDGIAILLAPSNLLTSSQSLLLKKWMKNYAHVLAVITLPESLFGQSDNTKSIFIFRKQKEHQIKTMVYPLMDIHNRDNLVTFMENIKNWVKEEVIS